MNPLRAVAPTAPPALATITVVRGFQQTPVVSGDEDSDKGSRTPSRRRHKIDDIVSANSSPMLKSASSPSLGGISMLKLSLDIGNPGSANTSRTNSMVRSRSNLRKGPLSSSSSDANNSDDERSDTTSFEVQFDRDFVGNEDAAKEKPIYGAIEGGLVQDTIARKMTAEDFEPICCVGKGSFGTVLLVKQRATGRLYAQKQLKKASLKVHKKLVEQTRTERSILESVNRHPFVVKLYYAFQDQEKLYLILEYAQGGELFTHLAQERMFSEQVASFYMAELVLALEYLHHELGVVYRDLKPENCLLDVDGHLLLTDFGLSKVAVDEDDRCNSVLGTVDYMAPEVIQNRKYGKAVDWWSFGALGFDLLTGSPPFTGGNHAKIQERIVKQKLNLPYFLSPDAKDLITRLLRKEPKKRLGGNMPKDMTTIKKHRFFRRIDWKKLARREAEPPIQPLITDPGAAENFSADFTNLDLSPILSAKDVHPGAKDLSTIDEAFGVDPNDPFGGFSYVASSSLLEGSGFATVDKEVALAERQMIAADRASAGV